MSDGAHLRIVGTTREFVTLWWPMLQAGIFASINAATVRVAMPFWTRDDIDEITRPLGRWMAYHMFQPAERVRGAPFGALLYLGFWTSLIAFLGRLGIAALEFMRDSRSAWIELIGCSAAGIGAWVLTFFVWPRLRNRIE